MFELVPGWGRFRFLLDEVKLTQEIQLQQINDDGEWELRELPGGEYIFADSTGDATAVNERFENPSDVRRVRGQRGIRAKLRHDTSNSFRKGIPNDLSPYSALDLPALTPDFLEIYEQLTDNGQPETDKGGWFVCDREGASAFFVFSFTPSEFDQTLALLLQPKAACEIECSVKGMWGSIEGGSSVLCLDLKDRLSKPAELYNLRAVSKLDNLSQPDSESDIDTDDVELSQMETWAVRSVSHITQQLERAEKQLSLLTRASCITAVGVVLVFISFWL